MNLTTNLNNGQGKIELTIRHGNNLIFPIVEDGVVWETERKGVPAKLTFTVVKDDNIAFDEGDHVRFRYDGKDVFYGFVFVKKRDKEHHITVTAYDQLYYFKNKDTYVYSNKTASELIKMIADDFNLQVGELDHTGYIIGTEEDQIEDNQTLFDIVQNALDLTLTAYKKMYVLYDNFGKITLKNIENMKLDTLICDSTAENFSYTTSIADSTYNQIKLCYENETTGEREVYMAKDSKNINRWGILQYYETIKENTNAASKADALLKLYNYKTRNLSIDNALGDIRVRAGTSVPVILNLGDIINKTYLLVEKVKHTFSDNQHVMNLTMKGGDHFV